MKQDKVVVVMQDQADRSVLGEIITSDPELDELPWWAYSLIEQKPEDQCVY